MRGWAYGPIMRESPPALDTSLGTLLLFMLHMLIRRHPAAARVRAHQHGAQLNLSHLAAGWGPLPSHPLPTILTHLPSPPLPLRTPRPSHTSPPPLPPSRCAS